MKRTRESSKMQAKASLRTNYWKLVLVGLLVLLINGGSTGATAGSTASNAVSAATDSYTSDYYYDDYYYDDYYYDDYYYDGYYYGDIDPYIEFRTGTGGSSFSVSSILGTFVGVAAVIALAVVFVLDIFVLNPLAVGAHRFFLVNLRFPAQVREVLCAFDSNYGTTVKTMLLRDVKIVLWSLLFIFPGIVKAYEYRMVPYLLAECPEMSRKEVFAASADLMYGNKWRAFVLDLSFIGWDILSTITLGLVGIFYVTPYQQLTNAAFYQTVCQEKSGRIGDGDVYN
ncbi:MAG: DUF975 family protein [Clostridiales bacterium]|nr:DUF975 family protein [Clostridiales bacterium]